LQNGFSLGFQNASLVSKSQGRRRRKARNMSPSPALPIYHMCRRDEWAAAQAAGFYPGSSQDVADGFIHFSTARQLPESAAKHRRGQPDLLLLTVDPQILGAALKWEPSRGRALFPHLYGVLPTAAAIRVDPLPLDADGVPQPPPHVGEQAVLEQEA
jgi:uncharacterized protein (DUF952 family)